MEDYTVTTNYVSDRLFVVSASKGNTIKRSKKRAQQIANNRTPRLQRGERINILA